MAGLLRAVSFVLNSSVSHCTTAFVDDITIMSENTTNHLNDIRKVFGKL